MQKEEIAAGILQNQSMQEIADKIGMSDTTVCRVIHNDSEVRELINSGSKKLLTTALPTAINNIHSVIEDFNTPIPPDSNIRHQLQRRDQGYDASVKMLQSIGTLPSHAPSTYVTNIMVQTNKTFITPIVSAAIDHAINSVSNEVIDVPIYDISADCRNKDE
jgi:hypothetical protein